MATANIDEFSENVCDPCKTDDEHVIAVSYCVDCKEYLCMQCHKTHRRLTATRKHAVKEKDNLQEIPAMKTNVTEISEECKAHPSQVISHYCVSHNELCCLQCLSFGHKICNDIKSITDYLNNFDMHEEEKQMRSRMRKLSDEVSKTMTLVQTRLKVIESCHGEAQSRMLDAKISAFDHIEKIYDKLTDEVNKVRHDDLEIILPCRHKCNGVLFDMNTLESLFNAKTKYSKKQLFFAFKKADAKLDTSFRDLAEINDKKHLSVTRYTFIPDTDIENLKTSPSKFGSLNIQKNAIKSAAKLKSLSGKDESDGENCCITGMTLVSDTHLVAADNSNLSLKLIDTNENTVLSNKTLEAAPWDVTSYANNKVAVTIPEMKIVEMLSIDKKSAFNRTHNKRIACQGNCYGITTHKDTLLVTVNQENEGGKLERYDLEGTLLSSVCVDVQDPQYVICNSNQSMVYIAGKKRDVFFNRHYIVEMTSKDFTQISELILGCYQITGMATDKENILYYNNCDYDNNKIELAKLKEEQGIERERQSLISEKALDLKCLVFCNETNRLFVGLDGNEISVYDVF